MRAIVDRRTAEFFALAYALTWLTWLPMLFSPDRLQYLHYFGSLGPLVAAFVMRYRDGGRKAVLELVNQMGRCRGLLPWLVFATLLPLVLFAVGAGVSVLVGQPVDLSDFLGSKEFASVGWVLVPIEIVFFGFGEETGWRGYAIPSLERSGRSSYAATTIFAMFWAGWHLPLFFYSFGLQTLPLAMVPGWLISLLFGAYLVTWIFNSAGKSLLVIAVFHGMVDIVSISGASTTVTLVTVNAGLIAAAVFVVVRYAPTLVAGRPPLAGDRVSRRRPRPRRTPRA